MKRFRLACAEAHRDAPGTGRSLTEDEGNEPDLPNDLADLVEGNLCLAITLYKAMPCNANLMYLDHWAPRPELLAELAALLDEPDDALADPVSYWLWCGPFEEDDQRATAAWNQVSLQIARGERSSCSSILCQRSVQTCANGHPIT